MSNRPPGGAGDGAPPAPGSLQRSTPASCQPASRAAPRCPDRYDTLAKRLPLRTALRADGRVSLEASGEGAENAAGRLLAAVTAASMTGGWERVKLCPAEDCQWAYTDQSRNQSRRLCAMGSCGNREKVRTYRSRQREDLDR